MNRLYPIRKAVHELADVLQRRLDTPAEYLRLRRAIDIEYAKQDILETLAEHPYLDLPGSVADVIAPLASIEDEHAWYSVADGQASFTTYSVLQTIRDDFRGGDLREWLPKRLLEIHEMPDDE